MSEQWRYVAGFEGLYEVSNLGQVRSHHGKKPIALVPSESAGYLYVTLCKDKAQQRKGVHQLVAAAFCPPGPGEPNHIDGNKHNNRADNLEWLTRANNQRHAADIGLKPSGERSHLCTKLTAAAVREIRLIGRTLSQSVIAKQFNISQTYVGKILRGSKWRQTL